MLPAIHLARPAWRHLTQLFAKDLDHIPLEQLDRHLVGVRVPDQTCLLSHVGHRGIAGYHIEERTLLLQLASGLEQGNGGVIVGAEQGRHPVLDEGLFEQVDLIGIEANQGFEEGPHQLAGGAHQQQGGDTGG